MVTVRQITQKKDLKKFVRFVDELYKDNKCYVPLFESDEMNLTNPKKNASFAECDVAFFLAEKDNKVVGRIMGIISHPYNKKNNTKRARFSRFECINDHEVADKLLRAAEDWARSMGCDSIHGPLGFNDLEREGLMVEGFDVEGCYITSYNFDYYQKFIEDNGYTVDAKWVEWRIPVPKEVNARANKVAEMVEKHYGFHEKHFKSASEVINKYGKKFFSLLDECYEHVYGTIPFSDELVKQTIKSFKMILDLDYISLIFNKEDELIGYGIGFPSLSKALIKCRGRYFPTGIFDLLKAIKHPKVIELGLIAVKPEYQKLGVTALIIKNMHSRMIKNGIVYCDTGCQLEDNLPAISALDMFEREVVRRKNCYIKQL